MKVSIRGKTISRYYNKLHRKARVIKEKKYTADGRVLSEENLYHMYSYKGSNYYLKSKGKGTECGRKTNGNFLDYVDRSQKVFPNDPITESTRKHMTTIRKSLK